MSTTVDTKQAELPHGTSESSDLNSEYVGKKAHLFKLDSHTGSHTHTHTSVGVRPTRTQACVRLWVTAHQQRLELKCFNDPSAAILSSSSHNYMLSRETSLANHCFLFAFLKGEVKLPAVNNAQSSLQYFSDSDIIEKCSDDTVLVLRHNYANFSVE